MTEEEIQKLLLNQYKFNSIFLALKTKVAQAHYDLMDYKSFEREREELRVAAKNQDILKKAINNFDYEP